MAVYSGDGSFPGSTSQVFTQVVTAPVNAWTNAAGGDRDTASNWSLGHVPTINESAVINLPGSCTVTHSSNVSDFACSLTSTDALIFSAGSLNVDGTLQLNNSFTLGDISILSVGGSEYIGYSGIGAFTQTGGQNTCANLYLGYSAGDVGSYSLSGTGSLSVSGNEYIGNGGSGSFIQTAGTNAVSTGLYVSNGSNGVGTYNLAGSGSLSVGAAGELVGYNGIGSFLQSGGSNTDKGGLFVGGNPLPREAAATHFTASVDIRRASRSP